MACRGFEVLMNNKRIAVLVLLAICVGSPVYAAEPLTGAWELAAASIGR
jgi:hypothetical protein